MSANDNFSLHDDEELSLHDDASLDGSVPASNKGDAPAKPPQIITTNTLSNIKLPVLQNRLIQESEFPSVIAEIHQIQLKNSSSDGFPSIGIKIDIENHSFSSNSKLVVLYNYELLESAVCKKGSSENEELYNIFFISRNTKSAGKVLRLSRDNLDIAKYGHKVYASPRSPSLGGNFVLDHYELFVRFNDSGGDLFDSYVLLLLSSLRNFPLIRHLAKTLIRGSSYSSSLSKLIGVSKLVC
ncbi:hypothetical protein Tco_1522410 [Tanacetum coccineum]